MPLKLKILQQETHGYECRLEIKGNLKAHVRKFRNQRKNWSHVCRENEGKNDLHQMTNTWNPQVRNTQSPLRIIFPIPNVASTDLLSWFSQLAQKKSREENRSVVLEIRVRLSTTVAWRPFLVIYEKKLYFKKLQLMNIVIALDFGNLVVVLLKE